MLSIVDARSTELLLLKRKSHSRTSNSRPTGWHKTLTIKEVLEFLLSTLFFTFFLTF